MAILKNTTVSGSLRATDTLAAQTAQFKILNVPTTNNGTTYGPGTNGNFLRSNGTSAYWASLAATDIPTISITDKTSGTLTVARGGTGATTAAGARTNLGLGTMATETAAKYLKWQTTSGKSTELYDFGAYVNQGSAAQSGPTNNNYFALINIPYRRASGNTTSDYSWQIGGNTDNNNRLWFRTAAGAFSNWQEIAHAPYSTNDIGSATQPVYMTKTGVITAGTALKALAYKDNLVASDIPDISETYATKTYVNNAFAANDAMIFKGTIAGGSTDDYGALTAAANRGDTYKVSTAGKINGVTVEVGDLIICTTDSTAAATADNYSTIAANWTVVQNNVDGAVFKGANAFTDGDILLADGTNGKIKDSGIKFDGSTTTKWLTQKGTWSTPTAAQVGAVTKLSSSTDNAIVRFNGDSGAIQNSGVTVDDNQNINSVNMLQTGRYFHNVATFSTTGTPKELLIKTKIPFTNGNYMPKIIIHMYNYASGLPTEIGIVFYIYSNAFSSMGVTSNTKHRPKITLCTYTESDQKYVAIGMGLADVAADNYPDAYYVHFNVDFLDIWPSSTRTSPAFGWEIISNNTTTSIIPTDDRQNPSYVDQAQTAITATKAGTGSTVTITSHTNTTNGNKTYYLPFLTATSGNLSPHAHSAVYLYETVANGAISKYDFCFGASAIKGSITLWDGTSHYGNIRTDELSSHRTYDLPNASGTIALTTSNITGTAANVTGTIAVENGGTGATTAAGARTNLGLGSIAVKADTDYVSTTLFKATTTTNSNLESTTNTIGYVSGLTKANWNFQQADGAIYAQFYSASWKHQIFGDYRTGQISVRGKNNGTWQDWRRILDETNAATILGLGSAAYTDTTAYATSGHDHDSTYLKLSGGTMTAAIKRYYSSASTDPTIAITSDSKDITALWIGHGTAAGNPASCYYKLIYKGTGNSPNNTLQLISAKNTTETTAITINEEGNVTFTNTVTGSITGNAGTATAFSANKEVKLTGDVTGSASSTGGWSIATTLANSGATAGSYGDSDAQTPGYGATFKVPYITVDAKGRVTAISEHTVKIPASDNTNTDTLVKQTSKSDDVNYKILTTTSASPTSGSAAEAYYSANITANPSTGSISAVRHTLNLSGTDKAYMVWNNTDQSIDFIFE